MLPVLVATVAVAALGAGPAHAALKCGDEVTEDTRLHRDLGCGPNKDGLIIRTSGVTLDLNGHTISSDPDNDRVGLAAGQASDVLITGGRVRGFATGILVAEASQITVKNMNVAGATGLQMHATNANLISLKNSVIASQTPNAVRFEDVDDTEVTGSELRKGVLHLDGGIGHLVAENHMVRSPGFGVFAQADDVTVRRNHIERTGAGVGTFGPTDTLRIARNRIEESERGIEIGAASTAVEIADNTILDSDLDGMFINDGPTGEIVDNLVKRSGEDGIDNNADLVPVQRNTANANGAFGIESDSGPLTAGNFAKNNGRPEQCFPATGCNQ